MPGLVGAQRVDDRVAIERRHLADRGDQRRDGCDDGSGIGQVHGLARGERPLVAVDPGLAQDLGQDREAADRRTDLRGSALGVWMVSVRVLMASFVTRLARQEASFHIDSLSVKTTGELRS